MYFLPGSPKDFVSGIGATRSPSSTTGTPSAVRRSPSPAIRNAEGPMSTPRRLPPRSSETPMMWTVRTPSECTTAPRWLTRTVNLRYSRVCGGQLAEPPKEGVMKRVDVGGRGVGGRYGGGGGGGGGEGER